MFIIFMAITWGVALSLPVFQQALGDSHSTLMTVLILPTVGWGTAVFLHAMTLLMDFGFMDRQLLDRAFARALREQIFDEQAKKPRIIPVKTVNPSNSPMTVSYCLWIGPITRKAIQGRHVSTRVDMCSIKAML